MVVGDILLVVVAAPDRRLPGDWAACIRREHHSYFAAAVDVGEDIGVVVALATAMACCELVEDSFGQTWSEILRRQLQEVER